MDLEEPKLFLRRMKLQSYRSNGMEWKSPEIYPYIHGQLIFDKGAKCSSTGKKKKKSFQQTVLNNQIIHLPKLQQQNLRTLSNTAAATAAKSLQSCPTLCDPIDGSPPGSPVPGILQARTLEWVAISFSNA